MEHSPRTLDALVSRYAELGFVLTVKEVESLGRRIEQVEAGIEAVRAIDVSAFEPQSVFSPTRYP